MADKHTPSEEAIERVLKGRSSRDLAIAYLRASRRAQVSESAFDILHSVVEANEAMRNGDNDGVIAGLNKARMAVRTSKQAREDAK